MYLKDFDYNLPKELIAQSPARVRDQSRLLVLGPDGEMLDQYFGNIIDHLKPNDLVIFNDSKVIRAKITVSKLGKNININLNREIEPGIWQGFAMPAKRLDIGDEFYFGKSCLSILEKNFGEIKIKFNLVDISIDEFLEIYGELPLPPYIKGGIADSEDEDRYQTIFAIAPGSVAAPTAGLHFTDELLIALRLKGIEYASVTLHVGAGTFLPVKTEDINEHKMHTESYVLPEDTARKVNETKQKGGRIIAIGTTSLRALESAYKNIDNPSYIGDTNIFIKPGFKFNIVDVLITNFHLPKSTLLMLTCAFSGYDNIFRLYKHAIENRYRFFSYGDACLLYRRDS